MPGTLLGQHADDMLDFIVHKFVDVMNVDTPVISANPKRRFLLIVNDSNTDVYLSFGVPAKLHEGVRLNREGGSMSFSLCSSSIFGTEVRAIHSSPSVKRLLVTEGY